MAITNVCGFECRQPGAAVSAVVAPAEYHWDALTTPASMSISTTTVRTGGAALRINVAATFAQVGILPAAGRRTVSGRIYVRFAALPSGSNAQIVQLVLAGGDCTILCTTAGALQAQVVGGTTVTALAGISTGVWYRLDFLGDSSTGTTSMKLRVNGGTEVEATLVQAAGDFTPLRLGTSVSTTMDVFYDDMVLGDAATDYPFGDGTVVRLKPDSDGVHSFTAADFGYNAAGGDVAVGATDVWSYLDEDDMNAIADFIRQKVVRSTGYVAVNFPVAPNTWNALAVAVLWAGHASGTPGHTFGIKMTSDAWTTSKAITDEAGDALSDFSNTAVAFGEKVLTGPAEGGAWTAAKIGAIEIRAGYATSVGSIPYLDTVALEIAYGLQPPPTTFVVWHNA